MTSTEREKLIQQYADGPRRLGEALAKVPAAARKWRPAPSEWSTHEVICHCADSETTSYSRIRYVLAEKDPLIVGYDQEEWARRFDYHTLPIEPALGAVFAKVAILVAVMLFLQRRPAGLFATRGRGAEA